jgi:hypothetical protein
MSHTTAIAMPLAAAHTVRHLGGVLLVVIGVAVWIGWPIVAVRHSEDVVKSHARLGYMIGDMTITGPLCLASGYGLLQNYRWGSAVLLLAVGAAAFDLTHFLVYLAQTHWPQIGGRALPWWAYLAAILATLAILGVIAWRELDVVTSATGGAGSGAYLTLAPIVLGALVSGALTVWLLRPPPSSSSPPGP